MQKEAALGKAQMDDLMETSSSRIVRGGIVWQVLLVFGE